MAPALKELIASSVMLNVFLSSGGFALLVDS